MRFKTYFEQAKDYLKKLGIVVTMIQGKPVTADMLKEAETEIGLGLPVAFKEFYLEMGDNFTFEYRVHSLGEDRSFYWVLDEIFTFPLTVQRLRDDVGLILDNGKHPEMAECLNWVPIRSEPDGNWFCIDCLTGKIRYYETVYGSQSAIVADSIDHWVSSWSRYCFSDPLNENGSRHSLLESCCYDLGEGSFAWEPSNFADQFDRCKGA